MQIAIINRSKKVTNAEALLMTQACNKQLQMHIAPAWWRLPFVVCFYEDETKVPLDAMPIVIFDVADDPGALGYHTEENGVIYGRVFVNPVFEAGGKTLYDQSKPNNVTVSSVLSHEVAELFADPFINLWYQGPTIRQGNEYAAELSDPVEDDSYVIEIPSKHGTVKVSVSNFILPAWFDPQAKHGPFDYLNKLKKPFSMTPNGYMVVRKAPGTEKQVFGATYPEWRKTIKTSSLSRTKRRSSASEKASDDDSAE